MDDKYRQELRALLNRFATDWQAFNSQIAGYPIPLEPTLLSEDRATFRYDFMREEDDEFRLACNKGDLDGAVDALIDGIYVRVGTLGEMGVCSQPTWDEVQRANMGKRRGTKSTRPGSKGFDTVKPEGWKAPSHADYLTITSKDVEMLLAIRRGDLVASLPPQPVGEVPLQPKEALALQQEAGKALHAGELLKPGAEFFYALGGGALLGKQGYVLSVDDSRLEVKFYDRDLPQRMTVTRDEVIPVVRRPKQAARKPKVLVLGHARHGKDTVCEMLRDLYGLSFTSSSWFCAERVMMPFFGGAYGSVQECYDDRINHRGVWFSEIAAYNQPDLTRLGREILAENDVYCGLRSHREFYALRNAGAFDYAVWVDASSRQKPEGKDSCTVEPWMADTVIDNNGDLDALRTSLTAWADRTLAPFQQVA